MRTAVGDGAGLEFRLLGPLSVYRDGQPVHVGAARPQAMLATLLICAPAPRTKQFLLDAVWGEQGPGSGERIVPAYVYALRRSLDPPGTPSEASVLRWDSAGYRMEIDTERTDLGMFLALTEQARLARGDADPVRARRLLASALELCTGEALAGLPGPFLEAQRQRLAELRLSHVEQRIELDLELGEHHEVVAELQELLGRYPLRENLAANLMLALRRCGRRAEALASYARTRSTLIDELGIEPGPQLQRAQREVLSPEDAPAGRAVTTSAWVRRCDLPAQSGVEFTGRDDELAALLAGGHSRMDTISGMPGIGKTALALRAGYRLAERYPDGQLYLDLYGHAADRAPIEPAVALERLLTAVGVPVVSIPARTEDRAACWRAETARRRVLLVLDDAREAAQVRPLLPGGPGCRVLLTARTVLAELGGTPVRLAPLTVPESVSLFERLSTRRDADPAAVLRIARTCGGLPLALRVAAARLRSRPGWTQAALADRLDGETRLDELVVGDLSVRAALDTQSAELTTRQLPVFRALGELPAEFDREVLGADAADVLDELVELGLLEHRGGDRFGLHELVRCHARTMAAPAGRGPRVVPLREPANGIGAPPGIAG